VDYKIIVSWSESYLCPVIYFLGTFAEGNPLLIEDVHNILRFNYEEMECLNDKYWHSITQTVSFFFLLLFL
jgi:hypothetical protein